MLSGVFDQNQECVTEHTWHRPGHQQGHQQQHRCLVTVYVDDMQAKFGRMIMCHMIADTEAELHAMAGLIGVARRWYQGDHYDIALSKRAQAVAAGAREIRWRTLGVMAYNRRCGWPMGTPETAEQVSRYRGLARRTAEARFPSDTEHNAHARAELLRVAAAWQQAGRGLEGGCAGWAVYTPGNQVHPGFWCARLFAPLLPTDGGWADVWLRSESREGVVDLLPPGLSLAGPGHDYGADAETRVALDSLWVDREMILLKEALSGRG